MGGVVGRLVLERLVLDARVEEVAGAHPPGDERPAEQGHGGDGRDDDELVGRPLGLGLER